MAGGGRSAFAGANACRAPTTATTCADATPTGPQLSWDTEGRLTAWQNTSYFSGVHTGLEEALYDGEGQRIEQVDFGVRWREHDRSVSDQLHCSRTRLAGKTLCRI